MRIFAISDLHLSTVVDKPMDIFDEKWQNYWAKIKSDWMQKVAEEDLVLLAGDFSWAMRMEDVMPDFALFDSIVGNKIIIRGNHDYWWNSISRVRSVLPKGFYAIQNDCLRFGDVIICGTRGWLPPDFSNHTAEDKKIYLREIERLKLSLQAVKKIRQPQDKVICMLHFPPFNGRREENEIIKILLENDISNVVYGHLHGKDCRADKFVKKFGINFWLTSCDILNFELLEIEV